MKKSLIVLLLCIGAVLPAFSTSSFNQNYLTIVGQANLVSEDYNVYKLGGKSVYKLYQDIKKTHCIYSDIKNQTACKYTQKAITNYNELLKISQKVQNHEETEFDINKFIENNKISINDNDKQYLKDDFISLIYIVNTPDNALSSNTQVSEIKNYSMQLLHSYPKSGFYYYYSPDFNINNFKTPKDLKPNDGSGYHLFIYDKNIPSSTFTVVDFDDKITDEPSELFAQIMAGVNAKPTYFVILNYLGNNKYQPEICQIMSDNTQIKYLYDDTSKKFIKARTFDNGEIGIGNLCNPDWQPDDDI